MKRILVIASAILAVLSFGFVSSSCGRGYSEPVETITIGLASSIGDTTYTTIALEQQFFAKNGLNVTIRNYTEGLNALNGLLNGDVDIAGSSEYPIVGKASTMMMSA